MAENLTIARPYAEAVFAIAKEQNTFDMWSQELEALSLAVSDSHVAYALEGAPSTEDASKLLVNLLGDLLDEKGQNFVFVLGENNRFSVIPEIYQEFVRLRDDYEKIKVVEVVSAHKLTAADNKALVEKLASRYNATIKLTNKVDPSIIGGLVIRIGDEVIDGSVKTNLSRLSSTLK